MVTSNWSFPVTNIPVYGSPVVDFSTVFTSALATISPIADLMIQKIITGTLPTFSGDQIHYLVTVQNI